MLYIVVSAALLVAAASAAPSVLPWATYDMAKTENVLRFEPLVGIDLVWQTFKTEHGKEYAHSTEEVIRKQIFAENLKKIEMHNYLYAKGLKSYTMGVNQFSDMAGDEFVKMLNRFELPLTQASAATYLSPNVNFTLPGSVDWREKGYVTPVKNQGHCGSCWSFSATGAIEGQHFRKSGKLVSLSEQNLIDCDTKSSACNGGFMHWAFQYVKENRGIDTEESYPYEAKKGTCRYQEKNKGAEVTGFVIIPKETDQPADLERKLTEAIATVGPISIAINATTNFQHYKSGVFDEADCDVIPNHGVLAVGYGTLNGKDYYTVKNSWGTGWGDNGYVLMSRNKSNQCGIAIASMYPLV